MIDKFQSFIQTYHNHAYGLTVKVTHKLNFYVKVFNSCYFPDHTMDLVYILHDDR